MFNIFAKKEKEIEKEEIPIIIEEEIEELPQKEEQIIEEKPKKEDEFTVQSIAMGMDMKKEVKTFSRAFFNSKNKTKFDAYAKLQNFLDSLPYEKRREIETITYMEFKEKESQITTVLKNGFSQFLSKGANLNEETRTTVEMIFGDIKKLPSRGHRYWYFKIYIWQKAED